MNQQNAYKKVFIPAIFLLVFSIFDFGYFMVNDFVLLLQVMGSMAAQPNPLDGSIPGQGEIALQLVG